MPMFDDPKQELNRLQKVLLEDEEMDAPQRDAEWLENELAGLKAWLDMDDEDTGDYRQYAESYRQQAKAAARADYHDMEQEEDRKTRDDARGQQILTFLLLFGILAVVGYWVAVLL